MASETTRDSVRSVERALTILQCFTLDESALTLMEIARKMDLPMSTTVRIVSTLQKMGFLDRNGERSQGGGGLPSAEKERPGGRETAAPPVAAR